MPTPVAVLAADLHFSHKPPIARSCEPDWYATQKGYLDQLKSVASKLPIIVAGDILDRWNSPAELVNFLLDHLPDIYAVPGQHDTPNHRLEDIHRSAVWTLVKAGAITMIKAGKSFTLDGAFPCRFWGFGWNVPIEPVKPHDLYLDVAVVHRYIWTQNFRHPKAPEESHLGKFKERLRGYDVAVFGDNHLSFDAKCGKCQIINVGGFMRRRSDEVTHRPSVGLLMSDGSVERHYLDTSQDKFLEPEELVKSIEDGGFEAFIEELSNLGDAAVDFAGCLRMALKSEMNETTRQLILNALESAEHG